MKLKGIEIKPGMVIITKNARYIAFPSRKSNCSIAFANITTGGWTGSIPEVFVEKIYDLITDGESELLWSQEWNKEITMSEIAEKFGIPVEHLRIKKE
jgi:hypothetical protein